MNAHQALRGKTPKLLYAACFAGFMLGMLFSFESMTTISPAQHRRAALFGFYFFIGFVIFFGLLEKIFVTLVRTSQKTGEATVSPLVVQRMFVFRFFGWCIVSIGAGMAVPTVWRGEEYFWASLEALGPAAGLLAGLKIRRLILLRKTA